MQRYVFSFSDRIIIYTRAIVSQDIGKILNSLLETFTSDMMRHCNSSCKKIDSSIGKKNDDVIAIQPSTDFKQYYTFSVMQLIFISILKRKGER
jgi:hypothetical protein